MVYCTLKMNFVEIVQLILILSKERYSFLLINCVSLTAYGSNHVTLSSLFITMYSQNTSNTYSVVISH